MSDEYGIARSATEALALRGVSAGYGERRILREIDLRVGDGEFVALVGRSGTGKSTLLRVAAGLHDPTAGEVAIGGAPPPHAQRRKRIGLVFQEARLHPWLSVRENVALPLRVNPVAEVSPGRTADEWTARVGLASAARSYPYQLSGGMRQRVALARALALRPGLLLMDEPLASLDELTREEMRYELLELWSATGCGVLYVTHDLAEAVVLADRVVAIAGRPARVVGSVRVELPRPRRPEERRAGAFLDAVDAVRALLA